MGMQNGFFFQHPFSFSSAPLFPRYTSPTTQSVCISGKQTVLPFVSSAAASGTDKFGAWTGNTASYGGGGVVDVASSSTMDITFKHYAAMPALVVGTASFPAGLDTSHCGSNDVPSTNFPAFDTNKAQVWPKIEQNNLLSFCCWLALLCFKLNTYVVLVWGVT